MLCHGDIVKVVVVLVVIVGYQQLLCDRGGGDDGVRVTGVIRHFRFLI